MNWMKVALNALRWRLALLGLTAGLWGGVLHESALRLPGVSTTPTPALLLSSLGLGLGLGAVLAPAEALLNRYFARAWRLALAGALLGAALGTLGAVTEGWLRSSVGVGPEASGWLVTLRLEAGLLLTLALVGAGSGSAAGLYPIRVGRIWRGGLLGAAMGALLGAGVVLLAPLGGFNAWVNLGLLGLWGAVMALGLHWSRQRLARRWLRLLTGANEDHIFPMTGARLRLGKHERNDVPLTDFHEVYPYHCEIRWSGGHYEIIDNERGGVVLVNYRQVREHELRPGDLIKIGTALLQYGEAT